MAASGIDNTVKNLTINKDRNHCSCKVELTEEMLVAIKNYECLSLGFSRGNWPDLAFLTELIPKLERLRAQSNDIDWKSICELKDLKSLRVDGVIKDKVDFVSLVGLKSLEYHWDRKNVDSVLSHQGIEHLIVHGAKAEDFSVFDGMASLKMLEVVRGNFTGLYGVGNIKRLGSLTLDYLSKLEDVSALNDLGKLLYLSLGNCNKVGFDKSYTGLKKLRELSMLKQKNVASLGFVSSFPRLEVLKVLEMSINDGDLKFLENLPKLKALRMDMKKHYNLELDELKSVLNEKYNNYEIDMFEVLGVERF